MIQFYNSRPYGETLEDSKQIYAGIPSERKAAATAFLREHLVPAADQIRAAMKADPEKWWAVYHFGWGMATRNTLRQAGYGQDFFEVANLDDVYVELVEEALAE